MGVHVHVHKGGGGWGGTQLSCSWAFKVSKELPCFLSDWPPGASSPDLKVVSRSRKREGGRVGGKEHWELLSPTLSLLPPPHPTSLPQS